MGSEMCIRDRKSNRLRHFIGITAASERIYFFVMFEVLGVLILGKPKCFVNVGDGRSGLDAVHSYAFRRQLECRARGHLVQGGLGHAVDEMSGKRARSGNTGHVDDVTACCDQMRNAQHRELERRPHVDSHHAIKLLQRRGLDRTKLTETGVVDQDVQSTKLVDGSVSQVGNIRLAAQVCDDYERSL